MILAGEHQALPSINSIILFIDITVLFSYATGMVGGGIWFATLATWLTIQVRNFDPHRYHRLFPQTNYIALDCSAPPRQFIPGAPCTPTLNTGVADPALNSSLKSILLP